MHPIDREDKSLTLREETTLRLYALGYSYEEIAELRGVGLETVKTALKRIDAKSKDGGFHSARTRLVARSLRGGLLA